MKDCTVYIHACNSLVLQLHVMREGEGEEGEGEGV